MLCTSATFQTQHHIKFYQLYVYFLPKHMLSLEQMITKDIGTLLMMALRVHIQSSNASRARHERFRAQHGRVTVDRVSSAAVLQAHRPWLVAGHSSSLVGRVWNFTLVLAVS